VCVCVGVLCVIETDCCLVVGVLVTSFLGHLVDALVPEADEGRGSLRYSLGSWQPSFDPGVSEWGNLAGVMPSRRRLNL
jgi:hypothetical protein